MAIRAPDGANKTITSVLIKETKSMLFLSNAKMDVWRFPIEWLTWGCMHCDRANMGPNAVLQNNMCGITSLHITPNTYPHIRNIHSNLSLKLHM